MIAELAATPMEDIGVPLIYGIVPMLTLMVLHSAFSIASVKSQRAREFLNGTPSVLYPPRSHSERRAAAQLL